MFKLDLSNISPKVYNFYVRFYTGIYIYRFMTHSNGYNAP